MVNYVNKAVDKNGIEADIHDARFPDGAVPGMVKAQDGKLLVDEVVQPVGPVPVITIDGVDYYHKHEFNLASMIENWSSSSDLSLLTGLYTEELVSTIGVNFAGSPSGPKYICLSLNKNPAIKFNVYDPDESYSSIEKYTSRALIVVQSIDNVDDNTKICLPGCIAFYGKLEGTTFTSYWNEEADLPALPDPVNKVKDANDNEVAIHDARIITPIEPSGKFLKDDFTWDEVDAGIQQFDFGDSSGLWYTKTVGELLTACNHQEGVYLVNFHEYQRQYVGLMKYYIQGSNQIQIITSAGDSYEGSSSSGTDILQNVLKKHMRMPSTDDASVGDVLALGEYTNPEWQAPAGGGTKLYKHFVRCSNTDLGNEIYVIILSNSSAQISSTSDLPTTSSTSATTIQAYCYYQGGFKPCMPNPGAGHLIKVLISFGSYTEGNDITIENIVSDTVTEL